MITPANLVTLLNAANVILQANNDISFHDAVTATGGGNDLTLRAGRKQVFAAAQLYGEDEQDRRTLVAIGETLLVPVGVVDET